MFRLETQQSGCVKKKNSLRITRNRTFHNLLSGRSSYYVTFPWLAGWLHYCSPRFYSQLCSHYSFISRFMPVFWISCLQDSKGAYRLDPTLLKMYITPKRARKNARTYTWAIVRPTGRGNATFGLCSWNWNMRANQKVALIFFNFIIWIKHTNIIADHDPVLPLRW